MAVQYRCANENRRDALRAASLLNGIDYLEVVSEDQKTLAVHFVHNLPGQQTAFPPHRR